MPKGGTLVCYGDVDASGKDAMGEEFMIPSEKASLFFFLRKSFA